MLEMLEKVDYKKATKSNISFFYVLQISANSAFVLFYVWHFWQIWHCSFLCWAFWQIGHFPFLCSKYFEVFRDWSTIDPLFYVRNFRKIRYCFFMFDIFDKFDIWTVRTALFLCFHFLQNFHFLFMFEILEDYRTLHRSFCPLLVLYLSFNERIKDKQQRTAENKKARKSEEMAQKSKKINGKTSQ